jgi:hypothetical protein
MKRTYIISQYLPAVLLAMSASQAGLAANATTNAAPASLRAVFVIPTGA